MSEPTSNSAAAEPSLEEQEMELAMLERQLAEKKIALRNAEKAKTKAIANHDDDNNGAADGKEDDFDLIAETPAIVHVLEDGKTRAPTLDQEHFKVTYIKGGELKYADVPVARMLLDHAKKDREEAAKKAAEEKKIKEETLAKKEADAAAASASAASSSTDLPALPKPGDEELKTYLNGLKKTKLVQEYGASAQLINDRLRDLVEGEENVLRILDREIHNLATQEMRNRNSRKRNPETEKIWVARTFMNVDENKKATGTDRKSVV